MAVTTDNTDALYKLSCVFIDLQLSCGLVEPVLMSLYFSCLCICVYVSA